MRYLSRVEAAAYLTERGFPVAKNTLQKYATIGGGPKYYRFGNRALYTPDALLQWAEQKLSNPRVSTTDTSNKLAEG